MTELLRNPGVMRKVQEELDQVVGQNKCIEESKIGDLHYLQAVLKETLRLHPPVPLLVPHRAMEDTKFMSYSIPKDTQILVNVWAIGRDPVCWDDPWSFKPERFFRSNTDYKGHHFQFIPFWSRTSDVCRPTTGASHASPCPRFIDSFFRMGS
ncbi:hypothetical protein IFM89_024742 [Coptis chinensis]|uniref:Cytochrome P450 n=1 Tax=Coptis chinensis TaxID=261450 RepID=A0A835LFM1_9MAGN|nr:hypothetical protein IFM89_024742 [Coptis chinensis]